MTPIYLCGFMGCGKSRVGKLTSQKIGCDFVDLDSYIVENEGMAISEIFEKYGEPYFRELEAKYIKNMSGNTIVALGGGAILRDETAEFARSNGKVFFLNTAFETCYDRIKDDPKRPIAVNSSKQQLEELYNKRLPIYKKNSDYEINANMIDVSVCAELIKFIDYIEGGEDNADL